MMDEKKSKALEKKLAKGASKKGKASNKRIGGLSLHKRSASTTKSYGSGFPAVLPVGVSPITGSAVERSKSPSKKGGMKSPLVMRRKAGGIDAVNSPANPSSGSGSGSGSSSSSRRLSLSAKLKHSVSKRKKSSSELEEVLDVSQLQLLRDRRVKVFGVELATLLDRERDALGLLARSRGEGALVSDSRVPSEFKSGKRRHCIPFIVRQTAEYLRSTGGIKEAGLFRLCGKFSDMVEVQAAVDNGMALSEEDLTRMDTHTVGDLFKTFLRLLPHAIIPRVFFDHYMASTGAFEDLEERVKFLAALTSTLPADNWQLVRFLCEFFHEVASNSATNQMHTANLAIIFAPALFGDSTSNDQQAVLREVKMTAAVTAVLIDNYLEIFDSKPDLAAVVVAQESYNGDRFSFFKGEQLVVIWESEERLSIPVALVGGKVVRNFPTDAMESKCKAHEIMFETRSYVMPTKEEKSSATGQKPWEVSSSPPARATTVAVGPGAVGGGGAVAESTAEEVARSFSSSPSSKPLSSPTLELRGANGFSRSRSPTVARKVPPTPPPRKGTTPVPLRHRSQSVDGKSSSKLTRRNDS